MNKQNRNPMEDRELEGMFREGCSDVLPPEIAQKVTPFCISMKRILAGLVLQTFTLSIFHLNYLLPFIGVILQYLGYRVLRRENIWFKLCWWFSILNLITYFIMTVLNTILYHDKIAALKQQGILFLGVVLYTLIPYVCLWKALKKTGQKAAQPTQAVSVFGLMVWKSIVLFFGYNEIRISEAGYIVLIISYILLLYGVYRLSRKLEDAGYGIKTAPVKISNNLFAVYYVVITLTGMCFGYHYFGRYSMDWQPQAQTKQVEIEEIKTDLIALGFPKEILQDMTREDIADCANATKVIYRETKEAGNGEENVNKIVENNREVGYSEPKKNLRITTVFVELPGGDWKIIEHFLWLADVSFYGTEALEITPPTNAAKLKEGTFRGRIGYTGNNKKYYAPYHSLKMETYEKDSPLLGANTINSAFATFTFPKGGTKQRGYVSFEVEILDEEQVENYLFTYIHQKVPVVYPNVTAAEFYKNGAADSRKKEFNTALCIEIFDAHIDFNDD